MNYQDHLRIEREEGEKRGIEKGLKQGETNRTLALIRRYMNMKNCSFEDACHALLLTEEEIKTVRELNRKH